MEPFIVVSDGMDRGIFNKLQGIEGFDVHPECKLGPEQLEKLLPRANGLVIRSATKVTTDTLEKAPQLKYVIRAGEGTDNIDKRSCAQRGVRVSNTPGANSNSAAEHSIALMMTVLRKTAKAHASMQSGKWEKPLFTGGELWKKTLGIVGMGRIGRIVAKRLAGFELNTLFFDPFAKETDIASSKKVGDLKQLFSSCDIVTVHLPLNDETRGLIDGPVLKSMQSHAVLINASRGNIVDEDALCELLKSGAIRGAGIDVYAKEPLDENHPLRSMDNVVLTPHLGASTQEAQLRVGEMAVHQLQEFFLNGNLLNEVKA